MGHYFLDILYHVGRSLNARFAYRVSAVQFLALPPSQPAAQLLLGGRGRPAQLPRPREAGHESGPDRAHLLTYPSPQECLGLFIFG